MPAKDNDVDVRALAAIRPGDPVSNLREALGKRWRPPAAHHEGVVDIIDKSHGFTAWIDRDAIVRQVRYDYRFDRGVAIEGLRIGMSFKEADRARPDLVSGPGSRGENGRRVAVVTFPGGVLLNVDFTLETLGAIIFWDPTAIYPERQPLAYPAASSRPDEPFRDPNLKLVVMSALIDAKLLDLGAPEDLAAHAMGRAFDRDRDAYDVNPAGYDYLVRYPLTAEQLDQITEISFDGGNAIYPYAFTAWYGGTEAFDVTSLAGIEQCPNLTSFHAASMLREVDFRQLTGLRFLESVKVSVDMRNLDALLDMAALKRCSLMGDPVFAEVSQPGHPTRRIMETLKSRGVKVWVHWMSHSGDDRPPAFR